MITAWMPGVNQRCAGWCSVPIGVAARVNKMMDACCPAAAEPGSDMCAVHLRAGGSPIDGFPEQALRALASSSAR